eukprot:g25673.t1
MAAAPGFAVADDGRGVYVGGLPKHAEWQELKDHMKTAGEIEFCDVLYNDWGEPKGVGYVRYKTEAEAQSAILALNETTMEGRSLKVAPWTGRPPNTNSPGKMMRPKSLDPEKAKLVERIKAYQKGSNEQKETWYSFCGEVKDPARHDTTKLQERVDPLASLRWRAFCGGRNRVDVWDKKYHEATITYTAMNIDWAQDKGYENDGHLSAEEQAAIASAARARLFRWPELDAQDLHEVSFGPERRRFCSSADSPEALGDPGQNVFVISQMRRPSRLRHALHELYREGISAKIVDAVDGDGFRFQDEMERPLAVDFIPCSEHATLVPQEALNSQGAPKGIALAGPGDGSLLRGPVLRGRPNWQRAGFSMFQQGHVG